MRAWLPLAVLLLLLLLGGTSSAASRNGAEPVRAQTGLLVAGSLVGLGVLGRRRPDSSAS